MASDTKEIRRVRRQEETRGRKTPALSEEAYAEKLQNEQFVTDLLSSPWEKFKEALISVAGLQEGSEQYNLAVQGWHDRQYESRRRHRR